jgi:HemY protein
MRVIVWLVLLFTVAVVMATWLGTNDGLVTFYWQGWRTDLSLNLFVILLLGAWALVVAAVNGFAVLWSLPRRANEWRAQRREQAAQLAFREALAEFFSARYGRARKAAERALALQEDTPSLRADTDFRLLAQLLAAGSLHRLQDRPQRDRFLALALASQPERKAGSAQPADDAARLLAAEWALEDRDATRALDMLGQLPPGAARRTQALRLKLQAARMARQPLEALHMARLLTNHQAFSPVVSASLLRTLASDVLDGAHDIQQLRRLWGQFDAADRRDAIVTARAAGRAVQLQAHEDARQWLRPFWDRLAEISREDRETVALALIDACPGIGPDWLPRLESAAQVFGQEPAIVAAVAQGFAERKLWGKARRLLEQAAAATSLPGRVRRGAWRELAALARQEGHETRAAECERAAAAID